MKKYLFVQILTLVVGVGFFFWDDSPYSLLGLFG
jgi:hypothetical protein